MSWDMPEIANALEKITGRLVREFDPERIVLFGSHAWGRPEAGSDIDLLVIVSSSDDPPARRAARAYRSLQGLEIPTEIIVSTSAEIDRYRSVPASLTRRILEKGKVLYG